MSSSSPSYLTNNRLGIYILQVRVPVHIRQNRSDVKPLMQRSLRTCSRQEALRSARKMVVWMEDNEFDMDKYEREAQRDAELFNVMLFPRQNQQYQVVDFLVNSDWNL